MPHKNQEDTNMTQLARVHGNGRIYMIIKTESSINPYIVKAKWFCGGWHTKTVAKYADMGSALYFITDEVTNKVYL